MSGGFLIQAIVFLTAAVICVPLAKRIGMSSVLGYLIAGILIGPHVLGFIGNEGEDIMHFAEFGVVMMLFLVGLELDPTRFWRMRRLVLGMGISQLLLTTCFVFFLFWVTGLSLNASLAIGLAFSMSSTAIVLQTMKEKNLLHTSGGQSAFSTLLFQDIALIPILAIIPMLATSTNQLPANSHQLLPTNTPAWLHTLVVLAAIALVILIGKYLAVPLLRLIAKTRLRELFTASALLLVVSIALLMELVGLSPALGTFLAGVVLANSEYRHELESDLEPFKGLLLGLFFLSVGAAIDLGLIGQKPAYFVFLLFSVVGIKAMVLWTVGRMFKLQNDQNLLYTLSMSQIGEFSFVILTFMAQLKIVDKNWLSMGMALTAMSMTVTPILLLINDKWLAPRLGRIPAEEPKTTEIDEKHAVIIAGFGHFGSTLGRFLRANGVQAVYLDHDSEQVALLRKLGFNVFYGDASRVDLLEAAGAKTAHILISALDSPSTNKHLVETVNKHFPHLQLLVRAKNRYDAYDLMDLGVKSIYRESLDSSVRLGVDVLTKLGHRAYSAKRSGQNFIRYDEDAMHELYDNRHDTKQYISQAREQIEQQEKLLKADRFDKTATGDHAWDSKPMRKEATKNKPKTGEAKSGH